MKLKYFYTLIIAVVSTLVSCSDIDNVSYLGEVKVSQSYVAIPAGGGSVSIDVNAVSDWTVTDVPEWLKLSVLSGGAGKTTITFSAEAADATREAVVNINCAGQTQVINIIQMTEKADLPISTCAEVIAGADGKSFRVKGVCTAIANTTYGNWYLNDGTGEVYVYGTLDAKGQTQNFSSWGLEIGDEITVEGPKKTYNGTIELVDVTVISIEKSLIKVDSVAIENSTLPLEGGEFDVLLTCKGKGVSVSIPEDAKSWLSVTSIATSGTTATVTFRAAENTGGDRSTTLVFKTTDGAKEYSSETAISQKGSIVEVTIADFNSRPDGDAQYKITGVITSIVNDKYGNMYIKDATGEAYIYGTLTADGQAQQFASLGLKVGDIVTLVGPKTSYNGSAQMKNGVYQDHIAVTEVSIEEFLTKGDSKDEYYMVSGTIKEVANAQYGNLYITDGTNEIYVYGCYPGWGATGDDKKNFLETAGIKVGDKLTMIGYKDTYNGTVELCGGIYFSHESAE